MRIEVDRDRCEGHGLCEAAAPGHLHLDDDGELIIDRPDISDGERESATMATRVCPVAALRLTS
ncbi:ferredoxin [Pseudonocardia sp. GCM10023141]|uniref:ferredoxin n=1 Tax=Pseudonocardia sp. GCM10023141 TaxID=3252653 RepID=UPI00360EE374